MTLEDKDEKVLRMIAQEKYHGKKGSLARVVSDSLKLLAKESEKQMARESLIKAMEKGHYFGRKLYKTRDELYDRE